MKEKRKKSSSDVARMKIRISGNVDHLTAIQASSDPDYSKPVKEAVKKTVKKYLDALDLAESSEGTYLLHPPPNVDVELRVTSNRHIKEEIPTESEVDSINPEAMQQAMLFFVSTMLSYLEKIDRNNLLPVNYIELV